MLRGALRMGSVALLIVCLLWMDICLYYNIQTIGSPVHMSNSTNHSNNNSRKLAPIIGDVRHKVNSASSRLMPMYATIEETSTIYNDESRLVSLIAKFSYAFRGMSVKLMMTDPVDNYLLGPLAEAFGDMCNFRDNFHYISANMVSFAGVLSALVAAGFVSNQDCPTSQKLAFVFFQLRNWLDDLDGIVARSRLGITRHVSLNKTPGYVIDGVCDAIGFLAFIWGVYLCLKQSHYITYRHLKSDGRTETRSSHTQLILLISLFLVQLALCSAGWNKYILKYNDLLESASANQLQSASKLKILKSNIMFIITWFWRLTNGHSWMQFLAISVLMGKVWHFLEFIKFIGFVEILILASVTHLHTIDIKNYLLVLGE